MRANMNDDELAAISPPFSPAPRFMMLVLIISGMRPVKIIWADLIYFQGIPRRGFTPALHRGRFDEG